MEKSRLILPGRKGADPVVDYNRIDASDSAEMKQAKLDYWMAEQVGTYISNAYKGRDWMVKFDSKNGLCIIGCPSLSGTKGYHIHVNRAGSLHGLQERAKLACGEILERYGVSRDPIVDNVALEALPRNVKDEVIANPTDTAPDKQTTH